MAKQSLQLRSPLRARHWKQRFDRHAKFVYLRRLRLGAGGRLVVLPGDPVTDADKERMGPARVRRWWDSKTIGLAEHYEPSEVRLEHDPEALRADVESEPQPEPEHDAEALREGVESEPDQAEDLDELNQQLDDLAGEGLEGEE